MASLELILERLESNRAQRLLRTKRGKKRKKKDDVIEMNPILKRLNGIDMEMPEPLDVRLRTELSPS